MQTTPCVHSIKLVSVAGCVGLRELAAGRLDSAELPQPAPRGQRAGRQETLHLQAGKQDQDHKVLRLNGLGLEKGIILSKNIFMVQFKF